MLGRRNLGTKAQSAIEYLTTYGWALLVTAVVLAAFFSLGLFSDQFAGTQCIASVGFLCQAPILSTGGYLSFTFGQNTGQVFYNVEMACVSSINTMGLPTNSVAWQVLEANGLLVSPPTNALIYNALTMISAQSFAVTQMHCYDSLGHLIGTVQIGQQYTEQIWMNYTGTPCGASRPTCSWETAKVASITVKAS